LVKYFLAKNNVTTLEQPPYSPDLDPALYLFPQLKSALMGWRFCDATDITDNATEKLKRLPIKWLPGMSPNTFSVASRSVLLHMRKNPKEK
jgi:transposase